MSAIGWLIAAVGGYIIYEKYLAPAQSATSPQATGTTVQPGSTPTQVATGQQTNVTAVTVTPGIVDVAPSPVNTLNAVQTQALQGFGGYANNHGLTGELLNTDQWNWYFQDATGMSGPAPELFMISPRNANMTYGSYVNLMQRWFNNIGGITGIPGLTGIGRLFPANYTGQYPTGRDYRSVGMNKPSAIPSGWELTNKRVM